MVCARVVQEKLLILCCCEPKSEGWILILFPQRSLHAPVLPRYIAMNAVTVAPLAVSASCRLQQRHGPARRSHHGPIRAARIATVAAGGKRAGGGDSDAPRADPLRSAAAVLLAAVMAGSPLAAPLSAIAAQVRTPPWHRGRLPTPHPAPCVPRPTPPCR